MIVGMYIHAIWRIRKFHRCFFQHQYEVHWISKWMRTQITCGKCMGHKNLMIHPSFFPRKLSPQTLLFLLVCTILLLQKLVYEWFQKKDKMYLYDKKEKFILRGDFMLGKRISSEHVVPLLSWGNFIMTNISYSNTTYIFGRLNGTICCIRVA